MGWNGPTSPPLRFNIPIVKFGIIVIKVSCGQGGERTGIDGWAATAAAPGNALKAGRRFALALKSTWLGDARISVRRSVWSAGTGTVAIPVKKGAGPSAWPPKEFESPRLPSVKKGSARSRHRRLAMRQIAISARSAGERRDERVARRRQILSAPFAASTCHRPRRVCQTSHISC